ncbi:MAG: hypothetical protein Q9166_007667 [cf. Caloplaca sp. 2 TL-2023]
MPATPSTSSPSVDTPTIKRSHSEMGSDHESHADIPTSSKRFATPLINLYVGQQKYHYTVHEAFLHQSRELKNLHELTAKKSKKGIILSLPRENPKEIGQVIEYLYFNNLTLIAPEPLAQFDELFSVWKVATQWSVIGMKRQVIQALDSLSLAEKVPALHFIKTADQMYECDIDVNLRVYFNKVSPAVIRKIMSSDRRVLDDMIEEGGSFAADLFSAYRRAFELPSEPAKSAAEIKNEANGHIARRARADAPNIMLIPMSAPSGPVDNRTAWDKNNNIPATWATASEVDRLLVTMVDSRKGWNTIAEAVLQKTGEKPSIASLLSRYNRLEANILRVTSDDTDLLAAAKSEIETEFKEGTEWPLVAARVIQKGGRGYEPMRLRFHCATLDAVSQSTTVIPSNVVALTGPLSPQAPVIKTEVVGGVRVDNTKAIDIKRRRRILGSAAASPSPRRPAQARKKIEPAPKANSAVDVSSDEDENGIAMDTGTRALRPRSKTAKTGRKEIANGDGVMVVDCFTPDTVDGNEIEGSSMIEGEQVANGQDKPIAIHDSDEEEL